ncbi:DUF3025 domain-containing protein [Moraxella nasovis]|uniref:DUF3025 domain-containing protein n=1 Tax=Moraxella nasovis TaxID=2904121 RepID=UPI001F605DDC|nr:DUF3025 domain-containing protein [Moraxella nasovis]UNU72652.1 DUF3025 domain-containing protein [Moraxella nasovis]
MEFGTSFSQIDIQSPWLVPFFDMHDALKKDMENGQFNGCLYSWLNTFFDSRHLVLKNIDGKLLSFTHQNDLPHGLSYEKFIGDTQTIPTRDNLHDWFGACIWSAFPKSKAVLNAKHLANLSDNNTDNKRNRLRDTITVFDENGAVLVVADDEIGNQIATGLQNFDWQTCLVNNRLHWDNDVDNQTDTKAKIFIFGHALLEQLIDPYKSLCSHTIIIKVHASFFGLGIDEQLAILDKKLADELDMFLNKDVTPRNLNPLPILGVPYFWDNGNADFYDDPFVFRQGRRR